MKVLIKYLLFASFVILTVSYSFGSDTIKPVTLLKLENKQTLLFQLLKYNPSLNPTLEIVAVGDILMARGVKTKIEKFGSDYPFGNVQHILSAADITIGNLENPLTEKCQKLLKKYQFQGSPDSAKILKEAGFDFLWLANNHSLDCGTTGLAETIRNLKNQSIRAIGAATNDGQPLNPVYFEKNSVKVGLLAFTAIRPQSNKRDYSNIGIALKENVEREIVETRKRVDVVIVSFHWGTEYAIRPSEEQVALAQTAIRSGADVVLGHHPHVLQGVAVSTNKVGKRKTFVAYSLGNFVFDAPTSLIRGTSESAIWQIKVGKNGFESARAIPVNIENYRPVIAGEQAGRLILSRLSRLSENSEQ